MSEEVKAAAARLENEMGDWGSISMRLADDWLADIRTVIAAALSRPMCRCGEDAKYCWGCAEEMFTPIE